MNFVAGDIVSLAGDTRQLVVVSRLDAQLFWVQLSDPLATESSADMYAFRAQDLRLIRRVEPERVSSLIPQIARRPEPAVVIAA